MVPELSVQMVGIGDLPATYGGQAGAGIHLEISVSRPGLDGLDYTTLPTELDTDAYLAVAATLRPLLALAGVLPQHS